jgi:hypothetical protein
MEEAVSTLIERLQDHEMYVHKYRNSIANHKAGIAEDERLIAKHQAIVDELRTAAKLLAEAGGTASR